MTPKQTRLIQRKLEAHIDSIVPSMLARFKSATVPVTVVDYVAYLRKKILRREPTWGNFLGSIPAENFIRAVLFNRHKIA